MIIGRAINWMTSWSVVVPKEKRPRKRATGKPQPWIRSKADERAIAEGCYFDEEAGLYVVQFFETFLKHTLGQWAGQPFTLLNWQRDDIVMPLFG